MSKQPHPHQFQAQRALALLLSKHGAQFIVALVFMLHCSKGNQKLKSYFCFSKKKNVSASYMTNLRKLIDILSSYVEAQLSTLKHNNQINKIWNPSEVKTNFVMAF